MAATSPRDVTSGYFRNHLYVLLGLETLALLIAITTPGFSLWPPLAGAVLSYLGSVLWLAERKTAGRIVLLSPRRASSAADARTPAASR